MVQIKFLLNYSVAYLQIKFLLNYNAAYFHFTIPFCERVYQVNCFLCERSMKFGTHVEDFLMNRTR